MIDTMTLFVKFENKKEWICNKEKVRIALKEIYKGNLHPYNNKKDVLVAYGLARLGFQEIWFKAYDKLGYYAMIITLRPKLLIEKNNYSELIYPHEIELARNKFNNILQDNLGLNLPDFINWRVTRIDYAIDIFVESELIPIYLRFFKKGNIPNYALNHPETVKWFDAINNCYICCNGFVFNCYNRYETLLLKQKKHKKLFYNVESTKNKLRFELQLFVDSNRLKHEKKIRMNELRDFLSFDLCRCYIEYHFDEMIGKGDYYKIDIAKKILKDKVDNQRKRMDLERVLELINSTGSIPAARVKYIENKSDMDAALKKFSKRISQIRQMNINPVTIPANFEIDSLKGLYDKVHSYFDQYTDCLPINEIS